MLENCQMTDFAKTFDQLHVKLSLELNVMGTKQFLCRKVGVNKIELDIKRDSMGSEQGVNLPSPGLYLCAQEVLSSGQVYPYTMTHNTIYRA